MSVQFHKGISLSGCNIEPTTTFDTGKYGSKTISNMVRELQNNINVSKINSKYSNVQEPREFLFKDYVPILDKVRQGDFSEVRIGDIIHVMINEYNSTELINANIVVAHKDPYYLDATTNKNNVWYMNNLYQTIIKTFIEESGITEDEATIQAKIIINSFTSHISAHHLGMIVMFTDIPSYKMVEDIRKDGVQNSQILKDCSRKLNEKLENRILKRHVNGNIYKHKLEMLYQEQVYGRCINGTALKEYFTPQLDLFKNIQLNLFSEVNLLLGNDVFLDTLSIVSDNFLAPDIIKNSYIREHTNIFVPLFFLLN